MHKQQSMQENLHIRQKTEDKFCNVFGPKMWKD